MKILIKTKGQKRRTHSHVYGFENDSALCNSWGPKPDDEWKIQEVLGFMDISYKDRCLHCTRRLNPKPLGPSKAWQKRHQRDMEKLAAWIEGSGF